MLRATWLVILFYWFLNPRDITREAPKKCVPAAPGIYIYYFTVTVLSETMLFVTVFWIVLHFILSACYILIESVSVPEPCELAYGTALLLSSAGVSVGTVLTSRDSLGLFYWDTISSFIYSILFVLAQANEFQYLGFYVSDSELGCIYVFLSGLHFIHVLYGAMILGTSSNPVYPVEILPIDTVSMDMYFIMDYYYWHIVEVVYIYIYISVYLQPFNPPGIS